MTQKELLYLEDAIGHETSLIDVLTETLSYLENEDLVAFIEKECKKHKTVKEKLMKSLEDCANE